VKGTSPDQVQAIGDKKGPLAKFLVQAYEPIETLTPSAVIEIARLLRRPGRGYSGDSWKWGDMDLRYLRDSFEQHSREADDLAVAEAREIEKMGERQMRELDDLYKQQAQEIEQMRAEGPKQADELLRELTREYSELRKKWVHQLDRMRPGFAPFD
jgi:hypothetical protein